MKKFPSKLKPENIHKFKDYKKKRFINLFRKNIYEYMLSENKDGFVIENYDIEIVKQIEKELNNLGWLTKLAYQNTLMYIYAQGEEKQIFKYSTDLF